MNNWRNKKVLISGVTGFVGGNLVSTLLNNGAEVFGIVRSHNPNCFL